MSKPRVCMAVDATIVMVVKQLVDAGFQVVDGSAHKGYVTINDMDGSRVYQAIRKGGKGEPWIVACYESPYLEWGIVDDPRCEGTEHGRKEEIERDQEHPGHPDQTGEDRDHLVGG